MVCLLLGARWIDYRGPRSIGSPRRGQWSRCTLASIRLRSYLPRKINTSTKLSTRGNCSIRGGTDDFSHFEIVGENRGLSRHCVADGSQRNESIARRIWFDGNFVCVIRFLLFIWILLRVVCVSSKEARNRSNLL